MEPKPTIELPEPPYSTDEELEELEKDRDALHSDPETFGARNRETGASISRDVNSIELSTFRDGSLEEAQNSPNQDPNVAFADPNEPVTRMDELQQRLDQTMAELAKAKDANKSYNVSRYALIVAIVSAGTALATLLYNAIKAATTDTPAAPEVPPDVAKKVAELVAAWKEEPDERYWQDLASYISNPKVDPKLTLTDQILFMNYTIDLFPGETFIWDSKQDAVGLVDRLVGTYHSNANQTEAMYREIPKYKYRDELLPRPVQAQLLRWALNEILIDG